jgi:NTE family protein
MPQKSWYNYKSSFDRKMKGNIIKTDITLNRILKISVLFDKGKEIIVKGEEATFAVYEKSKL